jgi:hypothetical protein
MSSSRYRHFELTVRGDRSPCPMEIQAAGRNLSDANVCAKAGRKQTTLLDDVCSGHGIARRDFGLLQCPRLLLLLLLPANPSALLAAVGAPSHDIVHFVMRRENQTIPAKRFSQLSAISRLRNARPPVQATNSVWTTKMTSRWTARRQNVPYVHLWCPLRAFADPPK